MLGKPSAIYFPAVVCVLFTAGSYLDAGLPNVTGSAGGATCEGITAGATTSALYATKASSSGRAAGSGGGSMNFSLNLSRNNAIYGNSNTVQPKSLTVRHYIKF